MTRKTNLGADTLGECIAFTPKVADASAAEQFRETLGAAFHDLTQVEQGLVSAVASCSPYLRRLMIRDPAQMADILRAPPDTAVKSAVNAALAVSDIDDRDGQMRGLRRAKDRAALAIALADIAGAMDVVTAAQAISDFADAALAGALAAACDAAGYDPAAPGIGVIAMGKHGARELNYSSDIDIVVLFDRERMDCDALEAQPLAVKITRDLVALLQQQTPDGYVFRTDLRLRPDPGVTNVALSVEAAETYYEAYGQNWERMAYIKARAAAGDVKTGGDFLGALRPFVWRKYLDYASIDDVKAVKRQIHSAKGGGEIEFEGHNIKVGRGGIREIEFYAQTQQLILGGKNPSLRHRSTLDALEALRNAGHVTAEECEDLSAAYRYLRTVEHRLQMINDEQTHAIPKSAENIARLAAFLGEDAASFKKKLTQTLGLVKRYYDDLFEDDATAPAISGSLVFTGVNDDPATLATLNDLGFERAADISDVIRRWHAGGVRATRTERARNLMTKLMDPLIDALSKASRPDDAFFAFDDFLKRLPAGVQVFSLLASNPELFDTLIRIMTISPFLGRELSKRTNIIERLLDNSWSSEPGIETYAPSLENALAIVTRYEDILNAVRRWAGEQKFLLAAQLTVGVLNADDAAARFTAIADACIKELCAAAEEEMRRQHGDIDGRLTVFGLGRLGAGEMTAASDIDLIFIYNAVPDAQSDGERPLGPIEYYTRLVRRIVTALSAATQEGVLYEVDMQLRPSGGAGPAAVSFSAFRRYYEEDAWTWEAMALTKARQIAGASDLGSEVGSEIERVLRRSRDKAAVAKDVRDMRERLSKAKPARHPWDIKNASGGTTDIAFICQYLALVHGDKEGVQPLKNSEAIAWLASKGALAGDDAAALEGARALFEAVLQTGRAATGGVFDPETSGQALRARMAAACGAGTVREATQILTARQSIVANIYRKVLSFS